MSCSKEDDKDSSWISWFCGLQGNEFFCEVDKDYIQGRFNLKGLEQLPHYRQALDLIRGVETADNPKHSGPLDEAAKCLYGQIHARYILTNEGIYEMLKKKIKGDFGHCPRVYCKSEAMLPIGLSDIPGEEKVKLYCPKCQDVYTPNSWRHQEIDGSHFGTGFPHMFFMFLPEARPTQPANKCVPNFC